MKLIKILPVILLTITAFGLGTTTLYYRAQSLKQNSEVLGVQTSINTPTPTPIPMTPTPTPTAISTPKVVYVQVNPTVAPSHTPNPAIQDRINQINAQIRNLINYNNSELNVIKDGEGCFTLSCTTITNQASQTINSNNIQIQALESEEAQLKIQLNE